MPTESIVLQQVNLNKIDPNSPFGRLILPHFSQFDEPSDAAAKHVYREPVSDAGAEAIAAVFKRADHDYRHLPFDLPDFIRHLFKALRLNLISSNDFLTAYMLFKVRDFQQFSYHDDDMRMARYDLGAGPYSTDVISYSTAAHEAQLHDATKPTVHHYYTFDLAPHATALIFYLGVEHITASSPYYLTGLKNYLKQFPLEPDELEFCGDCFEKLKQSPEEPLRDPDDYTMRQLIKKYSDPKLIPMLDVRFDRGTEGALGYNGLQFSIYYQTLSFLVTGLGLSEQMPTLTLSPHYDPADSSSPVLSFVMPSLSTLQLIQQVYQQADSCHQQPVVGALTPVMIRDAEDESMRPVEIVHPDFPRTQRAHNFDCDDLMLSWHDLFHSWRTGENNKYLIRYVRNLLRDKSGLTPYSMSRAEWLLSDIDMSAGRACKQVEYKFGFGSPEHLLVLDKAVYGVLLYAEIYFEMDSEVKDLIYYHFIKDPEVLVKAFYGTSGRPEQRKNDVTDDKAYKRLQQLIADYPEADAAEIIFRRLLNEQSAEVELLMARMKQIGFDKLVYWSRNSGLYFHQSVRPFLPEYASKRLVDNPGEGRLKQLLIGCVSQVKTIAPLPEFDLLFERAMVNMIDCADPARPNVNREIIEYLESVGKIFPEQKAQAINRLYMLLTQSRQPKRINITDPYHLHALCDLLEVFSPDHRLAVSINGFSFNGKADFFESILGSHAVHEEYFWCIVRVLPVIDQIRLMKQVQFHKYDAIARRACQLHEAALPTQFQLTVLKARYQTNRLPGSTVANRLLGRSQPAPLAATNRWQFFAAVSAQRTEHPGGASAKVWDVTAPRKLLG